MGENAVRVTSEDVARRAGVSRATVSYVLNDAPDQSISVQTREAVHRAARELGYRPNPSARSLRSGRSDIVLFPLSGLEMRNAFGSAMDTAAAVLMQHRLTLVTDFTEYASPDDRIDAWLRIGPAAVVDVVLRGDDPTHAALTAAGVRVLSPQGATGPRSQRPIDVLSDRAREVQVKYLLDAGHRTIVFAVPSVVHREHMKAGRQRGMHAAVKRAGAEMTIEDVELDRESMRAAVQRWKRTRPRPEAICAYNDELAVGLLSVLAEQGVRVPRDLAVIGVDDIPIGACVSPTLTTVTYQIELVGKVIAETVVRMIAGDELESDFAVPEFSVIVRESA
jgi:DNA-binding LacI/PurR family transcriptional regulator